VRGGFRRLVWPGTMSDQIEVKGTSEARRLINQHIRERLDLMRELEGETVPADPEPDKNGMK
jgi:hypothetical protein